MCPGLGCPELEEWGGPAEEVCQGGVLGHAAHDLYRAVLGYITLVEAKGNRVVARECLKGGFRDGGPFLGGGKQHEKGKQPQSSA